MQKYGENEKTRSHMKNKKAFQKDAYCLLADRIPLYPISGKGGGCVPTREVPYLGGIHPPDIPTPQKGPSTRDTHLPRKDMGPDTPTLRGQTDTCENITFPQLRWQGVISCYI